MPTPARTGTVRAMRHLGSLLAGLLVAPAVWLLLAIGQPQATTAFATWQSHNAYDTADLIGPVAYLAAGGLLLGLVASLRISPLGPAIAGVAYAAMYGVLFVNPFWGLDRIPKHLDLQVTDAYPRIPVTNGTIALLAGCLLTSLISAKRWREWPKAADHGGADDQAPPVSVEKDETEHRPSGFEPVRYDPVTLEPTAGESGESQAGQGQIVSSPPPWPPSVTEPTTEPIFGTDPAAEGGQPQPGTEPGSAANGEHAEAGGAGGNPAQPESGPWSAPPRAQRS